MEILFKEHNFEISYAQIRNICKELGDRTSEEEESDEDDFYPPYL